MLPKIDDRWAWLGFGVFIFVAAKGIRYAITDVVRLTKIDPYQYEPSKKEERPEDSISLEKLKILAESPNPNIANAAISLIVTRFARLPNSNQILHRDLASQDEATRTKAKQAINFIREWPLPPDVTNLEGLPLSAADSASDRMDEDDPDRWYVHPGPAGAYAMDGRPGWANGAVVPSSENPVAGWTNVPRERPVDEDAEEVERRRRRREAMVFHEGEGGVGEGDIIRPRG